MKEFGFTPENVVQRAQALLAPAIAGCDRASMGTAGAAIFRLPAAGLAQLVGTRTVPHCEALLLAQGFQVTFWL